MKRVIFISRVLLLLSVFLSLISCQGQEIPSSPNSAEIEIFMNRDKYPYMSIHDANNYGLYIDIIREAFSRMNKPYNLRVIPEDKNFLLEGNNGLIVGAYDFPEEPSLEYSEPLYEEQYYLYVRKGDLFVYADLNSLEKRKIGLIENLGYSFAFDKFIILNPSITTYFHSDKELFDALVNGKVDCIVVNEMIANEFLKTPEYSNNVDKSSNEPVLSKNAYLASPVFSKQGDILKSFNETLKDMKTDGTYESILQKYK